MLSARDWFDDGSVFVVDVPLACCALETEAAAQGLGITLQPDFIVNAYLARGAVVPVLEAFAPPPLGIYAMLPSNRYLPHRVRVLIDFLAAELGRS